MGDPARRRATYREYLAIEKSSGVKHSWFDGEILAMAGGSLIHGLLAMNVAGLLHAQLRSGPCRVYSSDARIRSLADGLATYPDLSVVCGAPERHPEDPEAATNPVVLIEVLSPGTERDDRAWKVPHYRRIDSVRHVLLVHQDARQIERFTRAADGSWRVTDHFAGDVVELEGIDAVLAVDEVYEGVEAARG